MIRSATFFAAMLVAGSALAAEPVANLSKLQGTVLVNTGEQFITAEAGKTLRAGDRVMVMEGGSARLTFNDGCALPVAAGSLLVVPEKSTCAGAVASVQRIGPNYAQAIGSEEDDDDDDAAAWWVFGLSAAFIAYEIAEGEDNVTSP